MDSRRLSVDPWDLGTVPDDPGEAATERRKRAWLQAYSVAEIVAGLGALAWASINYQLWPTISLTEAQGREGILLGLVFWILLGLLGSLRVQHLHGHGVLTFHLPFIIAATALGGPVAGGWVAMVSTTEARELKRSEVPLIGVFANHGAIAFAAVLAGVVFDWVRNGLFAGVTEQAQAATLVALVAATLVLSVVSTLLPIGTMLLRDGIDLREARRVFDMAYRATSASEVVLGWILMLTYASIGWWATVVCSTLVLVVWQAHDAREIARHDALTGLLSRAGFDTRLEELLGSVRRGDGRIAVIGIDLDKFKAVNDKLGHAAGDDVLREVGFRIRRSIRLTDAAVRRGGDEFAILFAGVSDAAAAEVLALKVYAELCRPYQTERKVVEIGASIGLHVVEPGSRVPTVARLHAIVDHEMYLAKKDGGGVHVRNATGTIRGPDEGGPNARQPDRRTGRPPARRR